MKTLNTPALSDTVACRYGGAVKGLFRAFALAALKHVETQPGQRVGDIACGPDTSTTLLAKHEVRVAAIIVSVRMPSMFERQVAAENLAGVCIHHGDGQALPFQDDRFDMVFSLFGLVSFADRAAGFVETFRTPRPGGMACVWSWSRLSDSPPLDAMTQVPGSLDPTRRPPDYDITSLEAPDVLTSEMLAAVCRDVVIHRVARSFEFAIARDPWRDLMAGSGPVAMMASDLSIDVWEVKSTAAQDALRSLVGVFPADLGVTAWLGVGLKPPG